MIALIPLSVAIVGLAMMVWYAITGGEHDDFTDFYDNEEEQKP